MIALFNEIKYAVKFSNGKYYCGGTSAHCEADCLKHAALFNFDWQPIKNWYLQVYLENTGMTYDLVKVKTIYQIVD